jgi:maltooligosyltrehalose trehalohydrolase
MIEVWAPFADTVHVEVRNELIELEKRDNDWWQCAFDLRHADDYSFVLDRRSKAPDPRSQWQPKGVHGPSRYVDHTHFKWTDRLWQARPLESAIIYELHVGTFTHHGTFDAVIGKLDHLSELGITHVELMPVAAFQGRRGWGYDGVSLFAPHESYGGPIALKRLVDACHARGLAILLDVVYNHLGPSGNYLPQFGPYFSERHSTPWGKAINFDGPDSDEVRRYFCDNALMWLRDYHLDGLRLDAVHAIFDTSAVPFLEQLATEVADLKAHLGRHFVLIAESDLNDPRVIRSPEVGGYGINAQWSDDIHHSLHTVLTGEREGYYEDFGSLEHLSISMQRPYVYAGRRSEHRRRTHGRAPLGLNGHQFIAYLQNHDQLGNRARGERLCQLTNRNLAKVGAALILTSPYVPMLFQGEEWACTSPFLYFVDFADEPDLAKAVAEGRCREFKSFGWEPDQIPDPNAETTFFESRLRWNELELQSHAEMMAWYKAVIELRRNLSALSNGHLNLTSSKFNEEENWLSVERGPVTILCNFSSDEIAIPCQTTDRCSILLDSSGRSRVHDSVVDLPRESVVLLGPEALRKKSGSPATETAEGIMVDV